MSAQDEPVAPSHLRAHVHVGTVAVLPSPSPLPVPVHNGASWGWLGWTLLIIVLVAVVLFVYAKLTALRDEIQGVVRSIEKTVKGHQKWLEEYREIPEDLRSLAERVREDRAELQGHRKMLAILKRVPAYQAHAALLAASQAALTPTYARGSPEPKNTPPTDWEQEGEVDHGD